jgi:hypothetical protein
MVDALRLSDKRIPWYHYVRHCGVHTDW